MKWLEWLKPRLFLHSSSNASPLLCNHFLGLQHSRSLFSSDFGRFHHLPVSNEDISVVFYYELNNPSFDEYTSNPPATLPSTRAIFIPSPRRHKGFLKHLEGRRFLMGLNIGGHSRLAYSYILHAVSDEDLIVGFLYRFKYRILDESASADSLQARR